MAWTDAYNLLKNKIIFDLQFDCLNQLPEEQNSTVHLKKQANKITTQNLHLALNIKIVGGLI